MGQDHSDTRLSIMQLPTVVSDLLTRAHQSLLAGAKVPTKLFVRYLRRKPGRGLAVIYNVGSAKPQQAKRVNDLYHSLSITLSEKVLVGPHIRFSEAEARHATFLIQPSGVLLAEELGLAIQAFPADDDLPALVASCDVTSDGLILQNLQAAAQHYLDDQGWQLIAAKVIPVRYKPASRCVMRYLLTMSHSSGETTEQRNVTIFGKVYANPQQAQAVQSLQQRLYQEQVARRGSIIVGHTTDVPLLPQPLGINETLGLTFNEAIQPISAEEQVQTGVHVLQPRILYGRGGDVVEIIVPTKELELTAIALAQLHTSTVQLDKGMIRTGAKEAKRAQERTQLIAAANSDHAEEVHRLAQHLIFQLKTQDPDVYRPAHGGFKASQLLFHSKRVFVVDFDGFCLADSALDVGYFLAYLRPSGLWYARPGMRQWYTDAAQVFTTTYRHAMLELGVTSTSVDGILERTKLYEAALLFKIATRRVNRLNSPRPNELAAMLREIDMCLSSI